MFKSIFRRKKSDPGSTAEGHESQGTEAIDQQEQQKLAIDVVLDELFDDLDPWDSESYSVRVSEVQCLWVRYKQLLQENNQQLTDEVLKQEPFASNFFLRQIWHTIPRDEKGLVTFPSFFGVVKWWQTADQETKLKGFIDEDQWLQALRRFSDEEIESLTRVNILSDIDQASTIPFPITSPSSPVPEDILISISSKIGERDWRPLAEKLGYTDKQIKLLQRQYPDRAREQTFQMLRNWSEKEGATKHKLDFALRRCGMDDILFDLQNE